MITPVTVDEEGALDHYAAQAFLAPAVQALRTEARAARAALNGRRLLMVSSTARGGGVAEMLPKLVRLLRDLGFSAEWVVMEGVPPEFFVLTKRLHNLIHGQGEPDLGPSERALYDAVSARAADALAATVRPGDVVVCHDPQPLGACARLRRRTNHPLVWRSHIGLDAQTSATRAAWDFLRPDLDACDHAVFTAAEYIPDALAGRSAVIPPGIDPASFKNRDLPLVKLGGILCNSGLARPHQPVLTPPWERPALRLQPDGTFAPAAECDEIGLGFRPVVLQVSRWDRLKGFAPLLRAFHLLKSRAWQSPPEDPRRKRQLQLVRLVLAGPEPASIQDDPEALEVLGGLMADYRALPGPVQADVALLSLPMASRKENALMVNVLQRAATVVVQNSLQEGFGLTAAEALWKRAAVLGTRAAGLRLQIRDGVEGRLARDPEDPESLADVIGAMLADPGAREQWGQRGQRRVYDEFLVFGQLQRWLSLLTRLLERPAGGP